MITLEEQQARLKTIVESITGLVTVYTELPGAIQHEQLPLLFLSAGDAEYDQVARGAQSLRIRRTWKGYLFVEPVELGITFFAEQNTKPFLTSVPVKLAAYPTVRLADGRTFDLRLDKGRDQGVLAINYNNTGRYTGTVFYFYTIVEGFIAPA